MSKFNYEDTLILFGRSPFINEIKEDIPKLIQKYHTMGCNFFCDTFPEVEYCIFYDDICPKVRPETTIVTNIRHLKNARKRSHKLCTEHYNNAEFYTIVSSKNADFPFSSIKGVLHFYLHTPSIAFNWAWKKGFKNVIIAGIDLDINAMEHFDADYTPDKDKCDFKVSTNTNARLHLTKTVTKYLNVYQLNPKSTIEIPKVTMEELLS